jgi:RHS repeat-associated protein
VSNPLVAPKQDSTTWHSGINVLDDAAGVYDGVSSGSWIEGGIAAFGTGLDLLTIAMNPVGTLISYGLNWLIEHVKPLQDALNQLAGDADQIAAYSQTWKNVGAAVDKAAKDLSAAVTKDTAHWTGAAADAYRANLKAKIEHLGAAATCANTIGTVVEIVGVITGAVRALVRDMVTQAVGDFIQDALEEVCSLGLGTPVVVAQVVEQVSDWIEKITGVIKKLINSVEALRPMMSKLEEIFAAVKKVMAELHGHVDGESHVPGEGGTHASSAEEPHSTPGGTHDGPTTESGAPGEPATGDGTTGGGDTASRSTGDGTHASSDDTGGGGQRSEGNGGCDGKGGDPVDTVSGQMITGATDVELPGLLALVLRRTYASGYRGGRLHGPGWSSTLDQRLEVDEHSVRYFGDDAQILRYRRPESPGGQVMPDDGARWPLTWDRDSGAYLIEDPTTGLVRQFGPNTTDPAIRPITALIDRNGNRVGYARDRAGMPSEVVHSGGYRVHVETLDTGEGARITALRLRAATGEETTLVEYGYDPRGRLTEIVDPTRLPYRYEYDDADRVTTWIDREDYRYHYVYGEDGRVVRGEGRGGFLSADFDYDLVRQVTTVTNGLGHTTAYHYDEHNHLTKVVDPLGNAELTEYDRYHRLLSRTDPLGATTRYTLGTDGVPVRIDRPDGTAVTVAYNSLRLPTEIAGPDGARWRYRYDERGNLLALTDPTGAITAYHYGDDGRLLSVTDALGHTTTFATDATGLPVSVTDASGATETYTLDARGRLTSVTDPLGAVTTTEWGPADVPARRVHPDGTSEMWLHDGNGDLIALTDQAGFTTRFEVGPFHLVTARTDPDGTRHVFAHDTELRLTEVTNPQGLTWRYTYDPAGNLVGEQDFDNRAIAYAHDTAGRLARLTNGAGETIAITRDALGRIIRQRTGDGQVITFTYDRAGQLVRAESPDCDLGFTRDPVGRILTETANGRTTSSAYDRLGRRVSRTTPTGHISSWEYDSVGRPALLTTGGRRITFGHDAAGRETHRWIGGATAVTSSWDSTGRLTARQVVGVEGAEGRRVSQLRHGRSWTYRADGVPDSITDSAEATRRFELDPLGRVTVVSAATWTERYAYDATGNITFADDSRAAGSPVAGARSATGTLLRRAGRTHFDYDAQSRLVRTVRRTLSGTQQVWTYRYDTRDRLTEVVNPAGEHWRYRYDALGRRTAKQRLGQDGVPVEETRFTWDGEVLVEQEHLLAGAAMVTATTWDHEPGSWSPVSQDRRTFYARAPQQVVDRQFHAIVTDLVGTPTELVTTDGRVEWRRRAGLWGNEYRPAPGQGAECLLRFPGQYHDYETGLDYNYHRYYDPETARYTSPDPLGLDPAPNHHGYVDNPLVWLDPLGLIARARYLHLDRPGWTNYTLRDANGTIYYSGLFGPGSTAASTQARHMDNNDRFNPANGDRMEVVPGTRTYGDSRLMEQRLAEQHGTIIGRDGDNYRGNRQNPLAGEKLDEYQDYEQRKASGLGCPT